MKNIILCRTTAKETQNFYCLANGKEYYLFSQNYRKSVKEYYRTGVTVDRAIDFSASEGRALRRTMEKLRVYIPYAEKEYGISILNKTKKAKKLPKRILSDFDEFVAA